MECKQSEVSSEQSKANQEPKFAHETKSQAKHFNSLNILPNLYFFQ